MRQAVNQVLNFETDAFSGVITFSATDNRLNDPWLEVVDETRRYAPMALSWVAQAAANSVIFRWYLRGYCVMVEARMEAVMRHPHRGAFINPGEWSVVSIDHSPNQRQAARRILSILNGGLDQDIGRLSHLHHRALGLAQQISA